MAKAFRPDVDAPEWKGGHSPYDILKEGTIALVVVALLTIMLAVVFGSPDEPSITIKAWSTNAPMDFATTALSELNGTSTSAQYGAPYNNASTGQQLGPLTLAKWIGVRIPVNTVDNFVIDPLRSLPKQPELTSDLQQWKSASPSTRSGWVKNYSQAAAHMKIVGGQLVVNSTNAGPLPVMMADLLQMARTGRAGPGPGHAERLLHDELHVAAALLGRRHLPVQHRPTPAPHGRPVGHDERDRQLPRSGLALALHLLVPSRALQRER